MVWLNGLSVAVIWHNTAREGGGGKLNGDVDGLLLQFDLSNL
jgi:hypothetical protein